MPRVTVTTALFGVFDQARATRGTIGCSSTRQKESDERLWNVERTLFDLGIRVRVRGDTIEIPGRPVVIQSFPATSEVARGVNAWMWWEDEMPAWRDGDGANPAEDRDATIVPAGAMHTNFRMYSVGTPLGSNDYHAKLVALGNTPSQRVYSGPSWFWNPTLTEARCRELQPDPRKFDREFAALPQAGALSAFDVGQIDRSMSTTVPRDWAVGQRIVLVDPTGGGADSFTFAICGWRTAPGGGQSILEFTDCRGIANAAKQGYTSERVVSDIVTAGLQHGADTAHADQFEKFALHSAFARRSFGYVAHTWTAPLKERACEHVRSWLRSNMLALPRHDRLRHELLSFEERIAPSGALTFKGRSGGHDDYAMLIMLAALVDIEGGLTNSPTGLRVAQQGLLEWYEMEAAALAGGPSPLIVATAPEELVDLVCPPHFAGSSTFTDINGRAYGIEANRIRARSIDIQELRKLGFTLVD